MEERTNRVPFDRKEAEPDDAKLKEVLGELYSAYRDIVTLAGTYRQEWKFYGTTYGWQLKATKNGKALFYLAPLEKSFRVGFAVREKEKEVLLNSTMPQRAKQELRSAKKYPEGYPLRFLVRRKSEMKVVCVVIDTVVSLRP
jgi:hypothetical protein